VQIQVQASYQGETAAATINQTNFATLAEAAKAGKAVSSPQSGANGASQAAAEGSHHVGLIATGAAAVAGGVVAKTALTGRHIDCTAEDNALFALSDVWGAAVTNYSQCVFAQGLGPCAALRAAAFSAGVPLVNAEIAECTCVGGRLTPATPNIDQVIDEMLRSVENFRLDPPGLVSCGPP